MDTLLSSIQSEKISSFHDGCYRYSLWPEQGFADFTKDNVWFWIEKNHKYNCQLWDEEDLARRINVPNSDIAMNKRNIDAFNQARNDSIEKIDECILNQLKNIKISKGAWFNSETAGSIIDRLSIISLKILHMGIQKDRNDIDLTQKENAANKKKRLVMQRDDLLFCFNRLLNSALQGKSFYRIYRQFKMYNDPKMNPYLSGLMK
jgi:hypothetical protein